MRMIKVSCLLLVLLFIAGCSQPAVKPAEPGNEQTKSVAPAGQAMRIGGSGTCLYITQKLADAYGEKTGVSLKLPKSIGTSGGLKALQAGQLDIALTARPLKDSEKQGGLQQIRFARVGFVFGVHPQVPDENITSADLVSIYKGEKNKWQNGEMIIVMAREAADGTNTVLAEKVPGYKEALEEADKVKRWETYFTDQEETDAIQATKNSFGYTDTGSLAAGKLPIKPLKFNGVEPTPENVKNGSYPLYRDLYLVYKEPLPDHAKQFLEFVASPEGQKIIEANGCIAVTGE